MSRVFLPHDYQHDIIDFVCAMRRCAVFALMGTGKTVCVLIALLRLSLIEDDVFPVLVIAPLRVARSTWPSEIRKWKETEHLTCSVITGTVAERKTAIRRKAQVYTVNTENLPWLVETLGDRWPWKTVVWDELTRAKGFRLRQGSKRAGALGKIAFTLIERFIGLTGTPTPNGLIDLWGQMFFIDKGERLGRTFSAFESRWFTRGYDGFSLKPVSHAQCEIEERLKDVCLTVEGLPVEAPIFNDILVDLPPAARKVYDAMEKEMFAEIGAHGVEAFSAAAKTNKIQQIASGCCYVDDKKNWEEVHEAKLEALDSVIEEAAGMPLLIAYEFIPDRERLLKRYPHFRFLDANPKTIDEWNAGKIPGLVTHPASAGHGLSLAEGGNIAVLFSPSWNLEFYQQIIERIGPQRQKQAGLDRPVIIHSLLARNTIDELVVERRETKASVQEILLAAFKRRSA